METLFTVDWLINESKKEEYKDLPNQINEFVINFKKNYAPSVLVNLDKANLAKRIFPFAGIKDNLCYVIERDSARLFGKLGPLYQDKSFPCYFGKSEQTWLKGTKKEHITEEEANELAKDLVDRLFKCCEIIESVKNNLTTTQEYENLYNKIEPILKNYTKYIWIMRYFNIIYPNLFVSVYNVYDWQKPILEVLGINPGENRFVNSGILSNYVKKYNIDNNVFERIVSSNKSVFNIKNTNITETDRKSNQINNSDDLSKKQWLEFLYEDRKDNFETFYMFNKMLEYEKVTCTMLGQKYGNTSQYYNNLGWQFGKRASEHFNIPKELNENGEEKYWTIPFNGDYVKNNELPGTFWWSLKPNLRAALNDLKSKNYSDFKSLLKVFVKQLRINLGIIEGKRTSGQGYAGDAIRNLYANYREYNGFTLDCNFQSGFHKTHSGTNYINLTGIGVDIRPKYNEKFKDFDNLYIDLSNLSINGVEDILSKKYNINDLDLFSENEPTDKLKELFDDYYEVIHKSKVASNIEQENKEEIKEQSNNIINEIEVPIKHEFIYKPGDGYNKIVYGTPGCGKSYYVKNTLLKDYDKKLIVRTTFYHDYSYIDFVGQIMPRIEKNNGGKDAITYVFIPGPFTLALTKAIKNPDQKVALVIEELNRGNAPSIFGDIFQLLDRDKDCVSEYGITNINIADYLNEQTNYIFNNDTEIKLPGNLSIIATMNTSDQNVFTLDTAFKRRWKFKKLDNKFKDEDEIKNLKVPGISDMTWERFVIKINTYILSHNILNSEDKQLGKYFVTESLLLADGEEETKEKIEDFAFKVLEYLWDDVAKFNRTDWFIDSIKSLDDLIDEYKISGEKVFRDDIFKD